MLYQVGKWEFNSSENVLIDLSSNTASKITPKASELLEHFIEQNHQVSSIADLMAEVWPGRVVGEHAVYKVITELRSVLSPRDKNAYIVNIPKMGYKLVVASIARTSLGSISSSQGRCRCFDSVYTPLPKHM